MNDATSPSLLIGVACLVALIAAYTALILGVDRLLSLRLRWLKRQQKQARQERLDRDVAASVARIGAAFLTAQQLLREESARLGQRWPD